MSPNGRETSCTLKLRQVTGHKQRSGSRLHPSVSELPLPNSHTGPFTKEPIESSRLPQALQRLGFPLFKDHWHPHRGDTTQPKQSAQTRYIAQVFLFDTWQRAVLHLLLDHVTRCPRVEHIVGVRSSSMLYQSKKIEL
jgi:hypothetical protein